MITSIKIGSIFRTTSDQLRQVIDIATDSEGVVRISYNSKSAKIIGRSFELAHTKAMPPSESTFKNDCGNLLSSSEIKELINSGIIQSSELI